MERRNLLLGAAIAAIRIPGWAEAFAQGAAQPGTKRRLERAVDAARAKVRPLLVLPASTALGPREDPVAVAWSHYLRFADDRALAELVLCEMVCVPTAEIAPLFPLAAPEFGPDAYALFVEPADRSAIWIRASLPALPTDYDPAMRVGFDIVIAKRNLLIEEQLHAVLVGNGLALWRRKRAENDVLTAMEREQVAMVNWDAQPTPLQIRLTPAAVLHSARGYLCRIRLRALADSAIARWIDRPPPGSTWEAESPCSGGPCGMGSVSPLARDFLRFYTTGE